MGTEFNLTDDQEQRIEGAKSAEERAAIIMEALDAGRELSDEDLEAVSGGQEVVIPPTHEEIDMAWNMVELVASYDEQLALCLAYDKKLIPMMHLENAYSYFTRFNMRDERARMHSALDAR